MPVVGLTVDSDTATLTLRARTDEVHVTQVGEPVPAHAFSFDGTVIDSEFGGRHMDVSLTVGSTRLFSRISAGARGSWARTLEPGQPVCVVVQSHSFKAFDESGTLVRLHHRTPASV